MKGIYSNIYGPGQVLKLPKGENMKSTYLQVKEKALPIIKHYQDDLLKHDRVSITKNGQQDTPSPFLHFTGDTGTNMIFFIALVDYPAKNERVPYLFGMADRHQILDEKVSIVRHMPNVHRGDLVLYFDGAHPVKTVTQARAEELVSAHRQKILKTWRNEK